MPLLKDVPTPEAPSCPTSVAKIASATQKEADALEDLSGSLWGTTEGPELLRRAAKLIRHAESLVRSPLCKGAEQKAAWNDLKGAAEAYSKARDALAAGQSKEVIKDLKADRREGLARGGEGREGVRPGRGRQRRRIEAGEAREDRACARARPRRGAEEGRQEAQDRGQEPGREGPDPDERLLQRDQRRRPADAGRRWAVRTFPC
ncbi:MAG: hypothetical protein IPG17_29210 [Sandaracinaceae bacterium]|nr:hypothetical protein [Sandaracinaceae bacterium]